MKADLHCHSYYSDGSHSIPYLLERAEKNQLSHLAITDHDCTHGLKEAQSLCSATLTIINGVEISCQWQNLEVHIVGLGIDPDSRSLCQLLDRQQTNRQQRILGFHEKLKSKGFDGLWPHMQSLPCIAYTRSHVADFLIQQGICKDRKAAFKRYLSKRGSLYVPSNWCSLEQAIATIVQSGGIAVLAHPGRYPLTTRKLRLLLDEFSEAGGDAMEVSYSNIAANELARLSVLCQEQKLWASTGSDFHSDTAHWMDIGKTPALPTRNAQRAIWLHPKWPSLISGA